MVGTRNHLAGALTLYLVLLPLFGIRAEAGQAAPPQRDPGPPAAAPRPLPPTTPLGPPETVFTGAASPLTIRGLNDFEASSVAGVFRHLGHTHGGGVASVDSPWGESLEIRYWLTPHGVTIEYDRDLKVRYHLDEDGGIREIVAQTPEREARMAVGNRAELAYLGQSSFEEFDMSAYQLIEETLRAGHSDAFLAGLRQLDGAAEASCATKAIQCGVCILVWAVSVAAISTACVVGGVVTFGTACLLAIIAHETTSFSCAATCIEMYEECFGGSPQNPIPDGCEP